MLFHKPTILSVLSIQFLATINVAQANIRGGKASSRHLLSTYAPDDIRTRNPISPIDFGYIPPTPSPTMTTDPYSFHSSAPEAVPTSEPTPSPTMTADPYSFHSSAPEANPTSEPTPSQSSPPEYSSYPLSIFPSLVVTDNWDPTGVPTFVEEDDQFGSDPTGAPSRLEVEYFPTGFPTFIEETLGPDPTDSPTWIVDEDDQFWYTSSPRPTYSRPTSPPTSPPTKKCGDKKMNFYLINKDEKSVEQNCEWLDKKPERLERRCNRKAEVRRPDQEVIEKPVWKLCRERCGTCDKRRNGSE